MKKTIYVFFLLYTSSFCFSQSWFTTGQDAELMVSGIDFNVTGGGLLFNHPSGLASDGNNLMLCDRFNNRVLVWNTAPTTSGVQPDFVLGQPDLNSNYPGTSKNELNWPGNVFVSVTGKVGVADTYNDRILLWNSFPTSNAEAADISISLPNLNPLWRWPWGIWTDGTKLVAVATQGSTILFWNSFPTTDDQAPDYTITNTDFGTPRNISTDGSTYFFVGDHNGGASSQPTTFFWNSYPTVTDQPYDFYRSGWIKGATLSTGELVAGGLSSIYTWNTVPIIGTDNPDQTVSPSYYSNGDGVDVVVANSKIYICNYNGNNVLVYNSAPTSSSPDPAFAIGVSNYLNNTLDSIGYIQNPSLATDGTRLIIGSDYDKAFYIYNSFPTSSGQMADQIVSTSGINFAPWDIALYSNTFVAGGQTKVCIWNDASDLTVPPSLTFSTTIGSATINDVKGVALDQDFFYVTDRNGKLFIWQGIPSSSSVNPDYTIDYGSGVQLGRLSSNGEYLCVTSESPAAVYIYKISDLLTSNTSPWKTINTSGLMNLPSEATIEYNSLAIANLSYSNVLLWQDVNLAPNTSDMTIIGQTINSMSNDPSNRINGLFWPGSVMLNNGELWVGEFKFSSRILKFVNPTTLIEEEISAKMFDMFPNPCISILQIKTSEIMQGEISIYSMDGRIVYSVPVNTDMLSLNLEFLDNGLYIVKTPAGSKKIIISK